MQKRLLKQCSFTHIRLGKVMRKKCSRNFIYNYNIFKWILVLNGPNLRLRFYSIDLRIGDNSETGTGRVQLTKNPVAGLLGLQQRTQTTYLSWINIWMADIPPCRKFPTIISVKEVYVTHIVWWLKENPPCTSLYIPVWILVVRCLASQKKIFLKLDLQ